MGANSSKFFLYDKYSGFAFSACASTRRGFLLIMPSWSIIENPFASADTLPRLPPGIITTSGTSQSNCWHSSIEIDFWPSMRSEFIELAR